MLELLPTLAPSLRPAAVRVMLGRSDGVRVMLDALEDNMVPLSDLTLEQRQTLATQTNGYLGNRMKALLAKGGALPDPDREKIVTQLLPLTQRTGDSAAGKQVFKDQCAKCHTHSGEGAKIGPDLTGMAVHPKSHLLGEIIDPNKSVEGNYRQWVVRTKAGQVLSGLLSSESRTAIEIIDNEAKKHAVQKDDLEEFVSTNKSLMPEGFEKLLNEKDLTNLLEFLTQRGKYLPLPLEKVATVVTTRGMFGSPDSTAERLVFTEWGMKTFEGVPFQVTEPQGDRVPNAVMLYGPQGTNAPKMPKSVRVPCNTPAKAVHLLSGISGWGHPFNQEKTVSMIVRLHYEDGKTEDHQLKNGVHFADYNRRNEVPESKYAFNAGGGRQIRYLTVKPERTDATIKEIEFVKGPDDTAPIVMAVTVEPTEAAK
jgi:putative heme-binding domain-containing protein